MAKKVCVIGAGITGLTLMSELSESDVEVTLLDQNPYPGGQAVFYGCKADESCVHCGVCLVREAVSSIKEKAQSEIKLSSRVLSLRPADGGGYEIDLETRPNPVDSDTCTACGKCREVCPENAAISIAGWSYYIEENCTNCGKCVDVCPVSAIDLNRKEKQEKLRADSIVLASGFKPFDVSANRKWGYHHYPKVVSGSDMEKLFFQEEYLPQKGMNKIAFIQCVGSRNLQEGNDRCSRLCCAYALRMANKIKTEMPEKEIDFYYMDIQRFGKDFDSFWERVKEKINLVRSMPIGIGLNDEKKPLIRFESIGAKGCCEEAYDLIVLSNGVCSQDQADNLGDQFFTGLDTRGFFTSSAVDSKSGIFQAGTCKGPLRIDECVEDASAVSEQVLTYLGEKI